MSKPKFTTVGAASLDVFLQGDALKAKRDVRTHDEVEQFPLGDKFELDDVVFSTGGTTNAAVTFARQGCDTSVITKVGDDVAGHQVIGELKKEKIDTARISVDLDGRTGYSTILLAPSGERTILVYRGQSDDLTPADLKLSSGTNWVYASSLSGNFNLLGALIKLKQTKGFKIAYNPSGRELAKPTEVKKMLKGVDILSCNKEEAALLFGSENPKDLLVAASAHCNQVLITDGGAGSWASSGGTAYMAGMYQDVKVVDRTGAGDAFGSGFVLMIAMGKSVEEALTFASANSTSVVGHVGAKAGILHASAKLKPMEIKTGRL